MTAEECLKGSPLMFETKNGVSGSDLLIKAMEEYAEQRTKELKELILLQDELISNLRIQLVTPAPTTWETDRRQTVMIEDDERVTLEISELKERIGI